MLGLNEEKRYFEVEQDYPKTSRYIDDLMEVLNKYEFDFLDLTYSRPCLFEIEYVGNDIEYKYDYDFDNKNDWYVFSENQRKIVFNHFIEALNDLKNKVDCGNIVKICNNYIDDYVIISMEIKFLD